MTAFVGTAGWCIPRASAPRFPADGTHLQRYAQVLTCAEINSSFYRPHARATYAKWAVSTPPAFRFAVKVPRTITHDQALRRPREQLARFLDNVKGLGSKCGPLLVQLPPSLEFDRRVVARFFETLRDRYAGHVVCEPRHPSWFSPAADALLVRHRVARVAADPAPTPGADVPGGWSGVIYYRLHGSPRKYWSRYDETRIAAIAHAMRRASARNCWCIFDNTASGAALENAWELRHMVCDLAVGGDQVPKRSSSRRELIDTGSTKMYGRRDAQGRFKEMDAVGRALTSDRRRAAKSTSKRGQGDRGDR